MTTKIPDHLLVRAYYAQNKEFAWARDDALRVIFWATESRILILGLEVWLPSTPGPTIPFPYVYTFTPKYTPGESQEASLVRANQEVADYVRTFAWDVNDIVCHDLEPFFNLTFSGS
jgi:hypothetical protein